MYKTTFTARVKTETEPKMRQLMGDRSAEVFFSELVDALYERRTHRNVPPMFRADMDRFLSSFSLVEDAVADIMSQAEKQIGKARDEAKAQAETLAHEMAALTSRLEEQKSRIGSLEAQAQDAQKRQETQNVEAVQTMQDWLGREKVWRERETQLQDRIARLEEEVQAAGRRHNGLKDEISELKSTLEDARRTIEAGERRLDAQSQSQSAELKAKDLEAERRVLNAEKSAKDSLSVKYESQIKDLLSKVDQARKEEREIASRAATNAEKKILGLSSQAEASRSALKAELAALTSHIDDLHKEYALKLEKARIDERDKALIREDEAKASQEKQFLDLTNENKILKQRFEALKTKQEETAREHQKALDGLSRRIEQARQEERAHARKTLDTLKSRVSDMEGHMDKAQETIQALKKEKGQETGGPTAD